MIMNFFNLDERQKGFVYKAGFESFIFVLILLILKFVMEFQDIMLFSGIMGSLMIGYIAVWFFNIRKTMMGCEINDDKRKKERNEMVVITIITTIIFIYSMVKGNIKWLESSGEAGPGIMLAVLAVSAWIITIIKTIYKVKGFED
jgi:hypothetical protein